MAIADVDAPEAGEGVEQFIAGGVTHEHAARTLQNGDALGFVRAIGADRMDQVLTVEHDERIGEHRGVSVSDVQQR